MEAIEFIKALERYCDNQCTHGGGCDKCELADENVCNCQMQFNIPLMNIHFVEYIEQWAKENPVKTRQSEFLKMFPDAKIGSDGILVILPCFADKNIESENVDCSYEGCKDCRRNYWLQEVE